MTVDALSTLKTMIDAGWVAANCDNLTPTVQAIVNVKVIDAADGDFILLYMVDESIDPFGLGATVWQHERIASIDIRTTYQKAAISDIRAHLMKMRAEVLRIIKANVSDVDSDHHLMVPKRTKDLSDKSLGLARMIIDVSMKNWE